MPLPRACSSPRRSSAWRAAWICWKPITRRQDRSRSPGVFGNGGAVPHPPAAGADRVLPGTRQHPLRGVGPGRLLGGRQGAGRAGLFRLADGPAGRALAHAPASPRCGASPRPCASGRRRPFRKAPGRRTARPSSGGSCRISRPLRPGWTRRRRFSPAWRAKSPAGCWTRCAPLRG